ncbi:MAG: ABC transporter permease [Steroidobacteraceae bacterium]
MKYLHLIWAALLRRKVRTLLTLLSVIAAFLLFGLLDSVNAAFSQAGHSVSGAHRMITLSKVGMMFPLPLSLYQNIQTVPGVTAVTYANWFGGVYQDPKNFFTNEAVGPNFFKVYSEFKMPAAEREAFDTTRTAAVVGATLARRFHWKVGDQIPLKATIFPQKSGSNTWTFDLVGIYHVEDRRERGEENAMFFRWSYFDEARAFGKGDVGWYVEKIADPGESSRVAQAIDSLSSNSDHETKTQTESAFAASFVSQFADIGLIVRSIMGAVFFTLVLLTGNTMAQAVRERTGELAILKTIGFSNRTVLLLLLGEALLLLVIGGVIGLGIAGGVVNGVQAKYGAEVPMLPVGLSSWLQGGVLMLIIGLLIGALPARRGMRLRIVDALAGR